MQRRGGHHSVWCHFFLFLFQGEGRILILMKVLFIGGTGNLSYDCTLRALEMGYKVTHLNRGKRADKQLAQVELIQADVQDEAHIKDVLAHRTFDAVVDFIAYNPQEVERDIRLFAGKTAQYVFISTASAYRKPPLHPVITESTPLWNPYWEYSQKKIICEEILWRAWRDRAFPMTIVRPSHTYCREWIPTAWTSSDFTVAARMLQGKEVVVQGDGTSLWTLTHSRDFAVGLVGLLGQPAAIGEAFTITGDEALSWDMIHHNLAAALGVEPRIVHVPSEFIARVSPELGPHFLGDKSYSVLFDNSKIKRLVPQFKTTIPFAQGIRESVAWYLENPERQRVNSQIDGIIEEVLRRWKRAMEAAFSM